MARDTLVLFMLLQLVIFLLGGFVYLLDTDKCLTKQTNGTALAPGSHRAVAALLAAGAEPNCFESAWGSAVERCARALAAAPSANPRTRKTLLLISLRCPDTGEGGMHKRERTRLARASTVAWNVLLLESPNYLVAQT